MAKYLGVDWASSGWFGVVVRDDGTWETDLFPSVLSVWTAHRDAARILIDVPIGLSRDGRRRCDERARVVLRPRRSASVFHTPCRAAVYERTLADAKETNERRTGDSISNQTWRLIPRIREVDEFLQEFPEAAALVEETHPEVCFSAFNGGEPMTHSKGTEEGIRERKNLLFDLDDRAEDVYHDAVRTYIDPPAYARRLGTDGKDDILDALAAALTARLDDTRLRTLPETPAVDSTGSVDVPLQIVYPAVDGDRQLSLAEASERGS